MANKQGPSAEWFQHYSYNCMIFNKLKNTFSLH